MSNIITSMRATMRVNATFNWHKHNVDRLHCLSRQWALHQN